MSYLAIERAALLDLDEAESQQFDKSLTRAVLSCVKAGIAERSGGHDNLVVAIALAVWLGDQGPRCPLLGAERT